jgi:hypothetical protein
MAFNSGEAQFVFLNGFDIIDYLVIHYNAGGGKAIEFFRNERDERILSSVTRGYRIFVARAAIKTHLAVLLKQRFNYTDQQIYSALNP